MNRRRFLQHAALLPLSFSLLSRRANAELRDIQSFAFYQGLRANEMVDPRRTDGTIYRMPIITADEIDAALPMEYDFWHGHGQLHRFELSVNDFFALQNQETIVVYTSVVGGHRHAVRIRG